MTREMKIRIARQLEKLGVDVIEAGFAAASPGDFEAVKAGAETVKNSTVCWLGRAGGNAVGEPIRQLTERGPNSDKVVWSTHSHNDLGLAVANSLSAVMNGARQVECTINGLGERAGNASLEEIVMAGRTRQDVFPCHTRLDTTQTGPA